MRVINTKELTHLVHGSGGDLPGQVIVKTTVGDLFDLVRPAGPVKPLPPHINVDMPVDLSPKIWPKIGPKP